MDLFIITSIVLDYNFVIKLTSNLFVLESQTKWVEDCESFIMTYRSMNVLQNNEKNNIKVNEVN